MRAIWQSIGEFRENTVHRENCNECGASSRHARVRGVPSSIRMNVSVNARVIVIIGCGCKQGMSKEWKGSGSHHANQKDRRSTTASCGGPNLVLTLLRRPSRTRTKTNTYIQANFALIFADCISKPNHTNQH